MLSMRGTFLIHVFKRPKNLLIAMLIDYESLPHLVNLFPARRGSFWSFDRRDDTLSIGYWYTR